MNIKNEVPVLQWLIDIILELVAALGYLTTAFVNRGDPHSQDWDHATLTFDGAWHDLDLSSIVPINTRAVVLRVAWQATLLPFYINFRRKGNVDWPNVAECRNLVSGIVHHVDKTVAVDSNREIQYKAYITAPSMLLITVAGWWL